MTISLTFKFCSWFQLSKGIAHNVNDKVICIDLITQSMLLTFDQPFSQSNPINPIMTKPENEHIKTKRFLMLTQSNLEWNGPKVSQLIARQCATLQSLLLLSIPRAVFTFSSIDQRASNVFLFCWTDKKVFTPIRGQIKKLSLLSSSS